MEEGGRGWARPRPRHACIAVADLQGPKDILDSDYCQANWQIKPHHQMGSSITIQWPIRQPIQI